MNVALADLRDHLAQPALALDDAGRPSDVLTVVDLDVGVPDEPTIAAVQQATTRVLIGVASTPPPSRSRELVQALDLTVVGGPAGRLDPALVHADDPAAECAALTAAVTRNPRASLALTGLLHLTEQLPVSAGLFAESAVYSMLLAGPEFGSWRAGQPRRPLPEYGRSPVALRRSGDELEVVLDYPQRRNAFSWQMRDGLAEAFDLVLADPSIAQVRVRGAGPVFCSGGDLDEFGTSADVSVAHLVRLDRSVAARIDRCRDRVSVFVHGAGIGAGIELPAFAGLVTAHPDTVFQLPELGMGLVPGAGGTVSITRRVGRWRTAYLALRGTPIDAATALTWGLVDQLTDDAPDGSG